MKKIILIFILLIFLIGCTQQRELPSIEEEALPEEQPMEEPTAPIAEDVPEQPEETEEEPEDEEAKPVGIPPEIEDDCFGFLTGMSQEVKTIELIGMSWSRPHTGPFVWDDIEPTKGNFDFDETDDWVMQAQNSKIAILATIWPYADWDQAICHSTECHISPKDQFSPLPKSRCAPCNINDYKDFLAILIERYDGDGLNDMPGLKIPIKFWEILNEPEMNEPTLTFYKGTKEEYVDILKASQETIKATCPDCKIVQGGAAGTMQFMLDYWDKIFQLGGGNYFDIANIHFIGSGDLSTLNVKDFKNLMSKHGVNKPIWVTEAEYNNENEVLHSVQGAFDAGAERIFFTRFTVGNTGPPIPGKYSKVYDQVKCK